MALQTSKLVEGFCVIKYKDHDIALWRCGCLPRSRSNRQRRPADATRVNKTNAGARIFRIMAFVLSLDRCGRGGLKTGYDILGDRDQHRHQQKHKGGAKEFPEGQRDCCRNQILRLFRRFGQQGQQAYYRCSGGQKDGFETSDACAFQCKVSRADLPRAPDCIG